MRRRAVPCDAPPPPPPPATVAAPAADNRVVQVTGLSPEITHHKLLGKIRDAGKVFSLRIIKTLLPGTPTISAGIVMWDWAATRRLVMQVEDGLLNDGHFEAGVKLASRPFARPRHPGLPYGGPSGTSYGASV